MITITPLDVYKCEKVIKTNNNRRKWILVGESPFPVPYFHALNDGLLGRKVVESLSQRTNSHRFLPMTITNNLYTSAKNLILQITILG